MGALDLDSLLARIHTFAAEVPRILRRVDSTTALADEVARLMTAAESPFTMAVVGQMRAGKSTLINALLGEDLAITGVNETTATVNWLKHGSPEQAKQFRVVWRGEVGREPELKALSELRQHWVGDSELAKQVRYLEFYSTASFLKAVQVVDTPGTRSVLGAHEETVRGFLAERHEAETVFYGGSADCILYVLNPVAREQDADLLSSFESQTRLPGGSPYNSVAVVHKWETLDHDDPFAAAGRKAATAKGQLQRYVADVIPVSGPLGQAVTRLDAAFWDILAAFIGATPAADLRRMLSGLDRHFGDRSLLERSGLPWPCFKAVIKTAMIRGCATGHSLRALVQEMAGIDRLVAFLHRRYFDRARVIRAFNLLGRAMRPCEVAVLRLHDQVRGQAEQRDRANAASQELGPYAAKLYLARW
jgi:hypothetical protein